MLFPKYVIPFFVKCKKILVVHDLGFFLPNRIYPLRDIFYIRLMLKPSIKKADHIITVSKHTKKDLVRIMGINEDDITVTYPAPNERYKEIIEEKLLNQIKQKYNLDNPFIFNPSACALRKNVVRLLKAFKRISDKTPHNLFITGGKPNRVKQIKKTVEQLNLQDRIKIQSCIPEEDMPAIYHLADLCVFPSLYEGFGFPIVEAMSCRCPVITSNTSSMPEVAGNAAILVDPYNEKEISNAIYEILISPQLQRSLVDKGLKRARNFDWKKTAKETLDIIEMIGK